MKHANVGADAARPCFFMLLHNMPSQVLTELKIALVFRPRGVESVL